MIELFHALLQLYQRQRNNKRNNNIFIYKKYQQIQRKHQIGNFMVLAQNIYAYCILVTAQYKLFVVYLQSNKLWIEGLFIIYRFCAVHNYILFIILITILDTSRFNWMQWMEFQMVPVSLHVFYYVYYNISEYVEEMSHSSIHHIYLVCLCVYATWYIHLVSVQCTCTPTKIKR